MRKKLTLLFTLLCASVMGWAVQYCGETITATDGVHKAVLTCTNPSENTYVMTITSDDANFTGLRGDNMYCYINGDNTNYHMTDNYSWNAGTKTGTFTIASTAVPVMHTPLYLDMSGEITFTTIQNQTFDWPATCGGGSTPDPDPDPAVTGVCSTETYNSNVAGYDIHAKVTKGCNKYYLTISSATEGKTITGLVGDNMFCNRYCDEARTYNNNYHMAAAGHYTLTDGKVIFTIPSIGDPKMYTPLSLMFSDNQAVEVSALNGLRLEPCSSEAAAECPDLEPTEIQDVNFALINNGAIAYASNGNAWEAIDGNDGSRWESAFSDPQWFIVDLGQRRIFNTVQIRWQTAYSRTFTIDVSNDGETWTTKKVESNYTGGGENVEYEVSFGENVTARYVRLHSTARATQWGNSFYSFRVLLKGTPILTSVGLAANTTIAKVGEYATLTPSPKDQNNGAIAANLSYIVTPADAGHVTDNKYYPDKYGLATITVTASTTDAEVTSNSVSVYGVLSDNLALSANISNSKVIAQSEVTGDATDAFYAVDGNKGSVWQACRNLTENQSSADFTSFYTLDLGNVYAINLIAIWFDGAASDEYTIEFSTNNEDWATGFSISQHVGNYTHQKYLSTADLNNNDLVRYVRFTTTKASTTNGWGMKIFEMEVYGAEASSTKTVSASVSPDATGSVTITAAGNPVNEVESGTEVTFTATPESGYDFINWTKGGEVVSTEATYTSTITANTALVANFELHRNVYCHTEVLTDDNRTLYLSCSQVSEGVYRIRVDGSENAQINSRGNFNFVVNNTTDFNTGEYDENTGRGWQVSSEGNGFAQNTFAAADYKAITLGSHYLYFIAKEGGNFSIDSHFPSANTIAWNSTCSDSEAPVFSKAEAEVLNATDVRLKIQATDNWEGLLTYTIAREAAEPIILQGASGEELTQDVTGLTKGTEYTFTITVSDGVNNTNQNIVVTPVADETKPVMGEASLVSKTWNSAIINVAATDNKGVTAYRVVNADPAINVELVAEEGKITVAGLTAATAYTLHIQAKDAAGNVSDNQAEVSFTTDAHLTEPQAVCAAPTWPAAQVKALYSPTYAADYNHQDWGGGTEATKDEFGRKYVTTPAPKGYFGADGFSLNCLMMEKLHYDIWIADDATIRIVPIWGGDEQGITVNLTGQQWNSIDINLSDYTGITNWGNIYQMKIDQAYSLTFWVANAYFYRTEPIVDNEAPTNVTASVAEEGFNSVKITVQATDENGAVNFSIRNGGVEVATGAASSEEPTTITVNGLAAGKVYNLDVIASDEAGNEAAPVAVVATTKALPAPAPAPVVTGRLVVPVFSDAVAGSPAAIHSGGWGETTVPQWLQLTSSDKVFYGQNFNYAGWHSFGNIDASNMQYLHVDIYSAELTQISVTPISPAVGTEQNHEGEAEISLTPGAWTSVDIALSAYDGNDIDWSKVFQFKFFNPSATGTDFFVDNVYFWSYGVATNAQVGSDETTGGWATFAAPVKLAVPEGIKAYKAAYQKTETEEILNLTEIHVIPAGAGVILHGAESTEYILALTEEAADDVSDNQLVGCVTRTDVSAVRASNDIFCMRYSELYTMTGFFLYTGQYVPAGRAYLPLPIEPNAPAGAPRKVRFVFNQEQVATGIENAGATSVETVKFIENGQLFIRRGEAVYTIQGVRVK